MKWLSICAVFCLIYQIQKREHVQGIVQTIGAVLLCYAMGVVVSFVSGDWFHFTKDYKLMEVTLLLSLPLLLLSTNLKSMGKSSGVLLRCFFASIISITISVFIMAFFLKDQLADLPMVMAGIESTYTGSTANLMSVHMALKMTEELFQLIFTGDFIVGAIYLLILLKITPNDTQNNQSNSHDTRPHITLFKRSTPKYFMLSAIINGICIGMSLLFFNELQSTFLILAITVISTLFTHFYTSDNKQDGVLWGEYFLLVFCFLMGLQFQSFELGNELLYVCLAFSGVLAINALIYFPTLCLIKTPKDEAVIAHIACIYGPPFILLFSKNMKRPDLLAAGIGLGSLGIAAGTFLGLFVYKLLIL